MIQYRGSILPLVHVAAAIGQPSDGWRSGHVVVVGDGDNVFGLQVEAILDVSAEIAAIKPVKGKPGITSFGVIQGKVIALLDVPYLLGQAVSLTHGRSTLEANPI